MDDTPEDACAFIKNSTNKFLVILLQVKVVCQNSLDMQKDVCNFMFGLSWNKMAVHNYIDIIMLLFSKFVSKLHFFSRRGTKCPDTRLSWHCVDPKMTQYHFSNFCFPAWRRKVLHNLDDFGGCSLQKSSGIECLGIRKPYLRFHLGIQWRHIYTLNSLISMQKILFLF